MPQPRRKLPIGIQTFAHVINENYYYVDKTKFAYQLAEQGKYYFLSRPRRFGKSLFLDTLKEMFESNEKLFEGLYCYDKWDWQTKYPVIRISFAEGMLQSREALDQKINEILAANQKRLGVVCQVQSISGRFSELIELAHEKYGQRVVVLVDEYDKPILDNITDPNCARDMRDGLRNLYSVIKGQDAHIRFVFLTGVSKFSKVSLFSGLNNLLDITVDKRYSAICGYSQRDVETVFEAEIQELAMHKIRDWYNGYNWMGESVYNPFDLLLLFDTREFKSFWFETGTPTFLIDVLMQRGFFTPDLERLHASAALLSSFDVDAIATVALLWQTGYLTLAGSRQTGVRIEYALTYPNLEVKSALNDALLKALMNEPMSAEIAESRLFDTLMANDFTQLKQHIESLFASIPHDWYRNNPIARYEGYYASVFYSHFAALGLSVNVEDVTVKGRIDMSLIFNQHIYLFEFKVVELVPEGNALQQLKDKNYAQKYRAQALPIHLIGIEFSREQRNVVAFEVENLSV